LQELLDRVGDVLADRERLRALLDAVVGIGTDLELHMTLERIVIAACRLAGARYGAIGVIGDDRRLVEFITHGLSPEQHAAIGDLPSGRGILGLLIDDPRPVRLPDIGAHPLSYGFPPNHPVMRSFLGVPVRTQAKVFGNLYLAEKRDLDQFTEDDEQLVVALAAAAGVAIDNAQLYAAAQRRQRWLVAAAEITDVLLGRVDRRAALRLVARRAREVGEAALALVLLHDDETGLLTVEVAESGDDETASELVGTTLSVPETEFADAVIARRHVLIEHLGKAAPWPTALAVRAATVVPLVTSEALHGLLVMAYRPGERRENGEDLAMLSAFAGQAALALERALAQEEREMLAVLEDRERIARDLHDVVIQRLFATGLQLQTTAQLTARPDVAARVNASVDDLDTTIRDIRSAIFELRTPVRAALRGELREVVDAAAGLLDFHPTLEVSGAVDSAASAELRADVLAVVREALSNVVRHAAASRVRVQVRLDAGWLTVTVEDDGVGTDPAVPRGGLTNLNERATRRGGSFTVQRMEPTGTLVDWRVPI
jgi:signal transduction histidine kinase